jgi:DNA-binding beta-propeller fold protein YncE
MRTLFLPLCLAAAICSQAKPPVPVPETPGLRKDGAVLLPNQWLLRPVGKQVVVGDFPVNLAIHPGGRFAVALHCGDGQHELAVLDLTKNVIVSRAPVSEAFYGLAFSQDGGSILCSGAGDETLHRFRFQDGYLTDHQTIPVGDPAKRGIPAGLAVSADGEDLFVANVWGQSVTWLRPNDDFWEPLELPLGDAKPGAPAPLIPPSTDEASVTKRAAAALETATASDPFPYACVLDEPAQRLYVSLWAQAAVEVIETETFTPVARWATEEHPNEMVLSKDGRRLFVANANRNSVSVLDTSSGRTIETLVAELQPGAEAGNTPNSLALSPDEKRLFVANANINTIAVFELSEPGKSRSLGFIPVGWYPTSVRVTPDGKRLLVANGKGLISKANRNGPKPGYADESVITTEYIARLFDGTIETIDLPAADRFEQQMAAWTANSFACMPETARKIADLNLDGNPIPRKVGDPSPIKYVLYIVKENRTYDQVLGDLREGNGDASLCLFGENVTPNHHALARDFTLLDNFYVDAEVSADGHEWTLGAYAGDFVEKTWRLGYGHNKSKKFPYPSEGNFPIATPAGGYLWDRAKEAGVTYRSYGEFVQNGKKAGDPATTKVPALRGHFDPEFHGFDIGYSDIKRADRFISELHRFEKEGGMPRLQILRMPSDHTAGASPGRLTPTAYVADNDIGLGMVIEAVSKSKFWPQTAVFIVEDDAQNGSDHVDAHRTIAFAVSPYVKHCAVDSTLYSTTSMLRTMELILGLRPMSQFDAAATPMFAAFQATPDLAPYTLRAPAVDTAEKNTASSYGARESLAMDFTKEDAADDLRLNDIIWRSVRGPESHMPGPRRAAFVFTRAKGDDD